MFGQQRLNLVKQFWGGEHVEERIRITAFNMTMNSLLLRTRLTVRMHVGWLLVSEGWFLETPPYHLFVVSAFFRYFK